MDEIVLVYTTWPDAETAQAAGEAAVEARLAACANILAPMRAVYRWEGRMQREVETPMFLKTKASSASALRDLILRRHPYKTPCFIGISVRRDVSNTEFLDWIEAQSGAASPVAGDKSV